MAVVGASAHAQQKPNILVMMGDDVGWYNIGAYHQGIMSGKTPNLDKLAAEGMRFTDYYAEASCTAGRANFITGELPIRTGLTTVGQAGADVGLPDQAVTLATVLKSLGYETGQFGKNHLGDLNKYLPSAVGIARTNSVGAQEGVKAGSTSRTGASILAPWASGHEGSTSRPVPPS
jgi:arylsulfatase A-like enzyme